MSESGSLALLKGQRSHVLFVLSSPKGDQSDRFRSWLTDTQSASLRKLAGVLSVRSYEPDEVDITRGKYPPLPFRYLTLVELSIDGAEAAELIIAEIERLHQAEVSADALAVWLYFPICEKVGRAPPANPPRLTLAFANGTPGTEDEFREWYVTRHIRHAMIIPALTSGQCFERTAFQRPGALDPGYHLIAVYEQAGTPEDIIASFGDVPEGALSFPMLDRTRFAEWCYRPLAMAT